MRLKTMMFTTLILIHLIPAVASSQTPHDVIDSLVNQYVSQKTLHGAVLVAENGKVVYENACGVSDAAWDIPNTTETKFKIYSMTKQFTAVLVLQQAAEGKIDLDAPVSRYLDWFRKDLGEKVTIHQLLCHTHGITEADRRTMPYLIEDPPEQAITKYLSGDTAFEPGSQFQYSGLAGYTILGAVLEEVTGLPFRRLLQERILDPAGMKNTLYLDYHLITPGKAEDYLSSGDRMVPRLQAFFTHANGASSIVSTTGDLMVWNRVLRSNLLLPDEWREKLFTVQSKEGNSSYGYGWFLSQEGGRRFAFHGGGMSNLILRDLDQDRVVILLNNLNSPSLMRIGFDLLNAMSGH